MLIKILKYHWLILLFIPLNMLAASSDSTAIYGYWLNDDENTIVEIYAVEGEIFGKIVWMDSSENPNDNPLLDVRNKDVNLRNRPIVGINVLSGFEYVNGVWRKGKVYHYKNGHSYNAKLKIDNDGNLLWTGYYGILVFLSKTRKWFRIEDLSKYQLN